MSNLPTLKLRAFDEDGDIAPGAKMYFFEPGTEDDQPTYLNADLSTPQTNPVVADSHGWFPVIYFIPSTNYRVRQTESDDTLIFDIDDVEPTALDGELNTTVYEMAENPMRYGAVGNGVSDDTAAVQAAINAATATRSGVVDLLGRTYRCDTALTAPSGLTVRGNGTLSFASNNADACITATGTQSVAVGLTADALAGDTAILVASVSGVSAGDILHLSSSIGIHELVRVASVSVLTITLESPINGALYSSGGAAIYRRLTPVNDLRFESITLIGNPTASGVGNIVTLSVCRRVSFTQCVLSNLKAAAAAIKASYSIDVMIDRCIVSSSSLVGTGVALCDATRDVSIANSKMTALNKGVDIGATSAEGTDCHHVTVSGCVIEGSATSAVVVSSAAARFVSVDKCKIFGGSYGVDSVGLDLSIVGNQILGGSASAVRIRGGSAVVVGNRLSATGATCVAISSADQAVGNVVVSDNVMDKDAVSIIPANTNAITSVRVCGNTSVYNSPTDDGDYKFCFVSVAASQLLRRLNIDGNTTNGWIDVSGSAGTMQAVSVSNNNIMPGGTGVTDSAISINGGHMVAVNDNQIYSYYQNVTNPIYVIGGATSEVCSISRNVLRGIGSISAGAAVGIYVANFFGITINGNTIGDDNDPIFYGIKVHAVSTLRGVENVSICGNAITTSANTLTPGAITIYGGNAGKFIKNVVISGNSISSQAVAVRVEDYVARLAITGNTITNVASAASYSAIYISGGSVAAIVNYATISGNVVDSSGHSNGRCIHVNGYVDGATINGNVLVGGGGVNSVVYLSGAAASAVNNFSVSGNAIREGTYGIETSNTAEGIHDGNSFFSQATAITTGTITAGDSV